MHHKNILNPQSLTLLACLNTLKTGADPELDVDRAIETIKTILDTKIKL